MNQRKMLSMKRLYQMAMDWFTTRTGEPIDVLQSDYKVIVSYLDFVWKNKNK